MGLKFKEFYCDEAGLKEILDQMGERITEDVQSFSDLVFIGILKGGAPLADYLADRVGDKRGVRPPVAYLDITLYRDDMIDTQNDPLSKRTEIPFALKNKEVILVDDVLFTGRTVRAALTSILELGRPRLVRLATAVDRGLRELPIHADYVGAQIETNRDQGIRVRMGQEPDQSGIFIYETDREDRDVN